MSLGKRLILGGNRLGGAVNIFNVARTWPEKASLYFVRIVYIVIDHVLIVKYRHANVLIFGVFFTFNPIYFINTTNW